MSDLVDITMPESEEGGDASVLGWHVSEGDLVEQHQPLLEISTDKVTLEVSAPASGRLVKILVAENEEIHPGHILGKIDTNVDSSSQDTKTVQRKTESVAAADKPSTGFGSRLSPLVKKMVQTHNIDISRVSGTGRGGRVTANDVQAFIGGASGQDSANEDRLVPHTPMRRKIAERMVESMLKTSPHVTAVFDADMTGLIDHRQRNRDDFERKGLKLTFTAYFIAAAARSLVKNPAVNSEWRDDGVFLKSDISIGIAAALGDQGLIVPVIANADRLSLEETAQTLNDLVARARTNKLTRDEVQGGTFTITNHGVSGSLIATPIINQPQAAILGIGKTEKRVVVDDSSGVDSIQVRPMAYITLTIDHRILDGFQANQFLTDFVNEIENWK